ncbi:hypothetical protein RUM44_005165 [Polyplax serrata]|uniref:Uncharacterized protein n=1 Tax=Polyplax serrata TaxID=468196 RepID=A0ABR1AE76_POLSC
MRVYCPGDEPAEEDEEEQVRRKNKGIAFGQIEGTKGLNKLPFENFPEMTGICPAAEFDEEIRLGSLGRTALRCSENNKNVRQILIQGRIDKRTGRCIFMDAREEVISRADDLP